MIKTRDAEVYMTEQTVKELMSAIKKAKEEVKFIDEPFPKGDISESQYVEERKKRGTIIVKSNFSNIDFVIHLDTCKDRQTQESLGYRLV